MTVTTETQAAGRSSSAVVNTILNGKGAPKSSLGSNGDFYIDTRSLLLYGPKSKGKWPTPQSMQGPTGASGSDGKNGADGKVISNASINSGVKGEQGEKGEKGDQGLPGPAGSPGLPGAIGPAGPAGAVGPSGSSGSNGSNGAAGATGATGAQGAVGAKGDTGTTGPSEVTVISVPTFTLSTNSQFGFSDSSNLGNLESGRDYQFSIHLKGTSSVDSHVIGVDMISPGNEVTFSYSKHYFRYATYSNTATWYDVEVFGTIKVRAVDTSFKVRIIDGFGDTGTNPLTFTGKAYITLVGSIR
jgi:hypothetical protein